MTIEIKLIPEEYYFTKSRWGCFRNNTKTTTIVPIMNENHNITFEEEIYLTIKEHFDIVNEPLSGEELNQLKKSLNDNLLYEQ